MSLTRLRGTLLGVLVFAAALAVWDVWPRGEWAAFYFPGVDHIGRTAWDVWPSSDFLRAVGASLTRLALGYTLGSLAGIAVGLAMGASSRARSTLGPTTEFLRAVPVIAVLPIAIVLLGDGDAMRVGIIAFGVFFPVLVAAVGGVRAVPPEIRDTAALFRLGGVERAVRVYLPSALPAIFAGLRTALSIGLVLVVISVALTAAQTWSPGRNASASSAAGVISATSGTSPSRRTRTRSVWRSMSVIVTDQTLRGLPAGGDG